MYHSLLSETISCSLRLSSKDTNVRKNLTCDGDSKYISSFGADLCICLILAVGVIGVFCEDWGELEALRSGRVGSGGKLGCLRLITKWMFEISRDLCTFSSFR